MAGFPTRPIVRLRLPAVMEAKGPLFVRRHRPHQILRRHQLPRRRPRRPHHQLPQRQREAGQANLLI